jgi:hypothetical protein
MVTWIVISPEMWGHVHADCDDSCPCGGPEEDCCDRCGEWENNRHKVGEFEASDESSDDELVTALFAEGFLTEKGHSMAMIDDYSDGFEVAVLDDMGRKLFVLQRKEEV